MNAKLFRNLLISLGLALLGFWFSSKSHQAPVPAKLPVQNLETAAIESTASVPVLPAPEKLNQILPTLPAHPKVALMVNPRFTTPPKDMVADFKVVDGLVVAYGDTVIGRLPPGTNQVSGLTETHTTRFWKSNEIAYGIDDSVKDKTGIMAAIELLQSRTNVRFIPYTNQEDAIAFTAGKENCMSALGRIGGIQPIYLEPHCGKIEIAHEVMHALGFVHEQSRTDRDQFVNILWENIRAPFQSQFAMVPAPLMDVYGDTAFDPTSIMMYDPHIFSVAPERPTMELKNGAPIEISPNGLSDTDVRRVNRLYSN
jgi:hypothetical protein